MNQKIPYPIIGIIIGIAIVATTMPINKSVDVITEVTLSYPTLGLQTSPTITDITTEIAPHTLTRLPSIAGIVSSDNLKITISGGGKRISKSVGTFYRTQEKTYTVVLPNVNKRTSKITVELYEGTTKLDIREVSLS